MKGAIKLLTIGLPLALLAWAGIREYRSAARDPCFVPFDAVQYVPPFFKFDSRDPVPTTYVKEYYLNAVCPCLYKWLTAAGSRIVDVRKFQVGMTYAAYVVFVAVMGRVAWMLGGAALCLAVLAFVASTWIFMGLGLIGGAPRMYGYPLVALTLYSLAGDRPLVLAALTVLGAMLYPVAAALAAVCLAGWMLLRPFSRLGRAAHMSPARRWALLATTGMLTFAALLPLASGGAAYGRRLNQDDIGTYPEAGPDGGYLYADRLPYRLFGFESTIYLFGPLYSSAKPIFPRLNLQQHLPPAAAGSQLINTVPGSTGSGTIFHLMGSAEANRGPSQ